MPTRVDASAETLHWGYFDAALKPVATIDSGDVVTIGTVSGTAEQMPPSSFNIPAALPAIHQSKIKRIVPGHMLTGPVAVRGARAGQVLQVDIEAIDLAYDWGYTMHRPLSGGLPHDFPQPTIVHSRLDAERMIGHLPWEMDIALKPFFGVMGVAPPPAWGTVSTLPPRQNGGNLDNKELVAGTTLYLPIFVDGAMFSAGDGHGVQGDGEVCVTAIETGLVGRFRLSVRDDMKLEWPYAETPTHVITMAFDPDLDDCVVVALRLMLDLMEKRIGISRSQAYMLASLAADLRITQVVNGNKGVHCMLEKKYLKR